MDAPQSTLLRLVFVPMFLFGKGVRQIFTVVAWFVYEMFEAFDRGYEGSE